MQDTYNVYVRADDAGRVVAINSSAFLSDLTGWVLIDSGVGDRYCHAQGNYFPNSIYTEDHLIPRYKLVDGSVIERTPEEIAAEVAAIPEPEPSVDPMEEAIVEVAALSADNAIRLDEQDAALVELAALIAGGE